MIYYYRIVLIVLCVAATLTGGFYFHAYAEVNENATKICCKCGPTCTPKISNCSDACVCQSNKDTAKSMRHVTEEFKNQREWMIKILWESHVLPSMMLMTEQLSTAAMHQAMMIGQFFDAKQQLENQRLLQDMQAQAHKDYQPSESMCVLNTNIRSLAASDQKRNISEVAISSRSIQRQLLNADGIGTQGRATDSRSRWAQFTEKYCNPADMGRGLKDLCHATDPKRFRKDVDFAQTIYNPSTLTLDFNDAENTPDEEDIFALQANLYGSSLLRRIPANYLSDEEGNMRDGTSIYFKTRALAAKRSVAQSAYAAQTAMKTQGTDKVVPYMTNVMKEMGIREDEIKKILSDKPSYYAQMEFLTKTLFQRPEFYTNLYDKPANIDRKIVALQAIDLMQRRDMYKSKLRNEAMASILLELKLRPLTEQIENELSRFDLTGRTNKELESFKKTGGQP